MATHQIGAVLTLRDNMSATLQGVRREQSAFRQDVAATQRQLRQQMQVRVNATAATRTIAQVRTALNPLRSRIVTQVAIRDNAARERRRIQNELNALGRRAVAPVVRIRDSASSVISSIGSKLSALKGLATGIAIGGVGIGAAAGIAIKSGAELEQQQIAMKHFIGVSNQGKSDAEITSMRDSYIKELRDNANATPFTTSDVVGAGARAVNIMGGDTKASMGLVKLSEDMAALNPGKTISDAMEALADAKNGEFERMKEFGFKISADEFKGFVGKGKNDSLTSDETTKAYQMLLSKKLDPFFKGGASEQANSGTGLLSTIKGKLGSKVQDVGLGMLERLKPTLTSVIELIDKYSPQMDKLGLKIADGIGFVVSKLPTLKKYLKEAFEDAKPVITWVSDTGIPKIRDILGSVLDKATGVYNFFKNNWSTLGPLVEGIAIAFGVYKAVMLASEGVTIALTAAQLALNLAMNLNPIGLIITGIGLLIGAGILLYKNWDTVSAKASEVGRVIGNAFKSGVNIAIDAINWLSDKLNGVLGIIGVKIPSIAHIALSAKPSNNTGVGSNQRISGAADGTDNWRGGPLWVGERGPEILNLPRGSQIIPNHKALNQTQSIRRSLIPARTEQSNEGNAYDGYIASLRKSRKDQHPSSENPSGTTRSSALSKAKSIVIESLAKTLIVREEADIDKIVNKLLIELDAVAENM
ncbi:hypothetical protein DEAC_c14270 [Desulfosporosinus acididurans]|uniref:Phage-related minor tail protein n=1 Tax=Desulfosporosinus acididurans TaxID=476652 RepID=A0A0J1FTF6_9FIRM|nr:hypothetical protein [Desulfosporosinus acididurans]KLU66759.1 hypothetical protein DEAC_c14270 [Desulfosporosinus acididurans]